MVGLWHLARMAISIGLREMAVAVGMCPITRRILRSCLERFFVWILILVHHTASPRAILSLTIRPPGSEKRYGHMVCGIPGEFPLIRKQVISSLAMLGREPGKRLTSRRLPARAEKTTAGMSWKVLCASIPHLAATKPEKSFPLLNMTTQSAAR